MTADEQDSDWSDPDNTDPTDRSLITDISESLSYMSNESRANRKKQKLREELVRAHLEHKTQAPSRLKTLFDKLTRKS